MKAELPQYLYYYTTVDTFMKIISKKTFRFCSITSMNDFTDGRYYFTAIINWAKKHGKKKVLEVFEYQQNNRDDDDLVMCLTKLYDDAAQWERYAEKGRGVSLCLNTEELIDFFGYALCTLGEVFYIDEDPADWIEKNEPTIISYLEMIEDGQPLESIHFKDETSLAENLLKKGVSFKHSSFKSEAEYRLHILDLDYFKQSVSKREVENNQKQRYKEGYFCKGGLVTKYCDILFAVKELNDIIHQVILGPCSTQKENDILQFMKHEGFNWNVEKTKKSNAPLRG